MFDFFHVTYSVHKVLLKLCFVDILIIIVHLITWMPSPFVLSDHFCAYRQQQMSPSMSHDLRTIYCDIIYTHRKYV